MAVDGLAERPDGGFELRLEAEIPAEMARDFLAKLHYADEALSGFELSRERDRLRFGLREGADPAAVADKIRRVAQAMLAGYRPTEEKILVDRSTRATAYAEDPHPVLEAAGDLLPMGIGRYGFGPRLVDLLDRLDRHVLNLARPLAAEPYRFPSLIGASVLDRCRYLQAFPHALTFVSHLREDLDTIQRFAREARMNADGRLQPSTECLAHAECLLAPTVCFHWYQALADRRLEGPRTVTALGKCFRYESGNLQALERLWDFTMREVIFVGPADFVLAARQRALELSTALFDRLGLAYRIESANDPFFIENYSMQKGFQAAFDLKFELAALLPYKEATVAAGSFNYHQDFFGRSLSIQGPDGEPAHTACVGFGLERLALAVTAQYGPCPGDWPEALRPATDDV